MQLQEASALTWLTDEVLRALAGIEEKMDKASAAAPSEQMEKLFLVRQDVDSFAAAFDMAGCDALSRYSHLMMSVLDTWREQNTPLAADLLAGFRASCHHLRDFLKLKQRDASFSEWVLYADYRWLCEQTQQSAHPVQLWSVSHKVGANRDLTHDGFAQHLQANAEYRLSFVVQDQSNSNQIDANLLAFIRGRESHAAAELRSTCDFRAIHAFERKNQLYGHSLSLIVAAIEQQKLEFDALLKRTLLQNMSWLKGESDDISALDELLFYVFLAWQNIQASVDVPTDKQSINPELRRFAQQARWMPCKGVNYNRLYFNRYPEEAAQRMHQLLMRAQQAWEQFCASEASLSSNGWRVEIEQSLRDLGEPLLGLLAQARDTVSELGQLIDDPVRLVSKDIQIEIATMLLVLDSLVLELHGLEESQIELRLAEVARRLRCARLNQAAGAYAPWMQAQQLTLMQSQTSQIMVPLIQQSFAEAEQHISNFCQSGIQSHLQNTVAVLRSIQGAASALNFPPLATALERVLEQTTGLQSVQASEPQGEALRKHNLTHTMASLGLLLDMYAQGVSATDAQNSFDNLQIPPAVLSLTGSADKDLMDEPLTTIFLTELDVLTEQGFALCREMGDGADSPKLVDLRRTFHTMKGGARTTGLNQLAEVAGLLERTLNQHLAAKSFPSSTQFDIIERSLANIKAWQVQLLGALNPEQLDAELDYGTAQLEQELTTSALDLPPPTSIELPADWLDLPNLAVVEEPQVKTIGTIELSLPLYNAFLNEADEWSRQLALALSEWALDDQTALPAQTLTWAHALAGSSATVQFSDLAAIAKASERLIERVTQDKWQPEGVAELLASAAQEMRRLLHQFAAGFLKTCDPQLISRLTAYLAMPIVPIAPAQPSAKVEVLLPTAPALASSLSVQVTAVNSTEDDEIQAIFAEEGAELISNLAKVFRVWQAAPSDTEHAKEALRLLHTLKGSARLAQRQDIAEIAHQLESDLEIIDCPIGPESLQQHLGTTDQLDGLLHGRVHPVSAEAVVQASQPSSLEAAASMLTQQVEVVRDTPLVHALVSSPPVAKTQPSAAIAQLNISPTGDTIRVRSNTIDRLVNQAGEVMIARSRMESETTRGMHTLADLALQAQKLRDQLRELELQIEMQMQSRQAKITDQTEAFDPLELDRFTRAQELTRFMAEAVSDITTLQRTLQQSLSATEDHLAAQRRQVIDMQRYLLSTRMVEFNSISERLQRLVRMTAQEVGVTVELSIENGALEMDRAVIERMLPAFEHMLRNAIVHGIEPEAQRLAVGKSAKGLVAITLEQTGKDVRMTVSDDGRGIDTHAVLAKAQTLNHALPTQEPLQLIFTSGLSTANQVTELAGRGIGMDVVKAQVQALGGQITTSSQAERGTTFHLILPLTTAVTQIVLVRTASVVTAIPVNLVLTTLRLKPEVVTQGLAESSIVYADSRIPFHRLAPLIQAQSDDWGVQPTSVPVIVLQSASQTMAVQVDEVLGSQEAVVKHLGAQLSQLPGLTGLTVLPSGDTVLIYNPVALANVYGSYVKAKLLDTSAQTASTEANATARHAMQASELMTPLVLVVDDSITMRRVLQRLLQREGYRVAQAADGAQALDLLRVEVPALVLSDVEMPRMDGFELLHQIRGSERLQAVPVVMITSRIADKHRDHAASLGANAYLGKPYPEAELLGLIERFAGKANA